MAYLEVGMWEILNILKRYGRRETIAGIHRATGHRRKTIRRYVDLAEEMGWVRGEHEPDEVLATEVTRLVKPGPRGDQPGEAEQKLLPLLAQIETWLTPQHEQRRGLRLTKVHRLLERLGVTVPYSSLHRFAVKHCGFADKRRWTVRMADTAPGEVAQVDYGYLGLVPEPDTGRRRKLYALIVTLVYSRHQYVHVTHSQTVAALVDGLEEAWEFFGGVTRRVIVDNLKAAVIKPDRYDPTFQRVFEEYADYRGFVIDAAVPGHPKGKPHVERAVPYVREDFFRGEQWLGRDHVQREAIVWCRKRAGGRVHGTTRKAPLAVFENTEQEALLGLGDQARFDTPAWAECVVHPDHHISFGKALYSVPHRYVHLYRRKPPDKRKLTVRGDRGLVRIYEPDGTLIKTHPRKPPGGRSTDYEDYPDEVTPYAMRDPARMIREATERGEALGGFTRALLSGDFPWAKLRQAQKLMRLGRKYGWERTDQACRRALAFDLINVKRVQRIIEQGLAAPPVPETSASPNPVAQLPLRFARPANSFSHHSQKQGETDDRSTQLNEGSPQEAPPLGDPAHPAGPGGLREEGQARADGIPGAHPPGRDRPA